MKVNERGFKTLIAVSDDRLQHLNKQDAKTLLRIAERLGGTIHVSLWNKGTEDQTQR